jgi:hypothetical protein
VITPNLYPNDSTLRTPRPGHRYSPIVLGILVAGDDAGERRADQWRAGQIKQIRNFFVRIAGHETLLKSGFAGARKAPIFL